MAKTSTKSNPLKSLIKSALFEVIEENEALISQILEEAIEDAFLTKAIKDGRSTKKISRDKIFRTLAEVAK